MTRPVENRLPGEGAVGVTGSSAPIANGGRAVPLHQPADGVLRWERAAATCPVLTAGTVRAHPHVAGRDVLHEHR